jgi:tetratricopeptide (TPR) repeat protein
MEGDVAEADPEQIILSHLTSGRKHEEEGRDALAFAAYQEALRLAPGSEEARTSAERVRRKIADDQFRNHMSAGFTAYHKGDYALAKAEFQKAEAFQPGAPEAKEALALADGAIKLRDLEALRGKAAEAEEAEEWERALDLYLAALRIDGTLQFALEGRERAMERMTLKKRLDFYLQKPGVLESEDYLQKAEHLIVQAENVEPGGPRHREALQKVQELVREAQTEIPVTLISDAFTEVSVFKVGRLGTFDERELFLRPGKYTVVGVRNGYRDVRQEIMVKAGDSGHRITILCREKI